jgi:hypothetical protein
MKDMYDYIFGNIEIQKRNMKTLKHRMDIQVGINNKQIRFNRKIAARFLLLNIGVFLLSVSLNQQGTKIKKLEAEIEELKKEKGE